jgi:plastocyanin
MRFKRTVVSAVVLTALVGGLTACGDDDDSGDDDAAPAAEAIDLTVTASKSGDQYLFDIPAEIDGGLVNLTLTNTDQEPHEIAMVNVAEGTTPEDLTAALLESDGGPIPDYVTRAAGVGFAAPGQSVTASQDIPAGDYVYFCTFGEDDAVHYKNGMLGAVTVANEDGEGDLPDSVGSITAEDYTFTAEGLKAGTNKVKFENTGPDQIHHAQLMPIAEGATFEEALQFLGSEEEPTGPPPIDFESGTGTMVLAPGQEQVVDLTLVQGSYLVVCFIQDREGGPPHFVPQEGGGHGMAKEITVE